MKYDIERTVIAFCTDECFDECDKRDGIGYYLECLMVEEVKITDQYDNTKFRFVVSYDINEYDVGGHLPPKWEYSSENLRDVWEKFKEEKKKSTCFGRVFLCDGFEYKYGEYFDDSPYIPSATNGDYSPSAPWNAPGMSVSDFLPGVY